MVVEVAVVVTTGKLTFLVCQYLFPFLEMGFSKKGKGIVFGPKTYTFR